MGILLTEGAAQVTGATAQPMSMPVMLVVVVIMYAAMYFILIRPQKKEQKRLKALIASVAIGDYVLTNSGFYGTIIDVTEDTVIVEFGNNKNCRIPMQKTAIAQVEKADAE